MSSTNWRHILYISGIVFLIIDILIGSSCFAWYLFKRYKKRKGNQGNQELQSPLLIKTEDPFATLPVKKIEYTPDIFEIPGKTINVQGNERNLRIKSISKSRRLDKNNPPGYFDINKYLQPGSHQRKLSSIPRLYFELRYNFRTSCVQVTLKHAKHLPDYANEQIIVSILMSHCFTIYQTAKVNGPHPIFNEEVNFPLDSMAISSDPPILLKFNVWTIDRCSRKTPFGYVEVSIEEVFTQHGVTPPSGEGEVWRNVMQSDTLTDEDRQGEVLISLSYLPGAQRISLILIKAKDIIITTNDKEIQGRITLLCREIEQKIFSSKFIEISSNPNFNEEFTFDLSDYKGLNIDGVGFRIEMLSRQSKIFMKPQAFGKFYIGNSGHADRFGKEHWATMLTTHSSVTKWHTLKPCDE